jgi:hypothetical protein
MWDIKEKRITNEKVRRTAANSPTMESMMEVLIPKLVLAGDPTTKREARAKCQE